MSCLAADCRCPREKKEKKKKVMFILARAHEFNWLLIACGSENFMIGFGQGPSRLSCLAVGWFGWAMFDSDLIMRDHVGPHVKPCVF
jgi:hypothetical protein